SPEEGADFTAGDNVLMEVVASDDRGLEEVTFTIGEWSTTVVAGSDLASHVYVDSGTFSAQLPAPIMEAAGELQLTARAVDVFGNDFTATRTIQVAPLDNPKSPEIVSPCPVHEDLVAPGLEIPIPYAISDDHKIESYRVEVNGEILDEWTPVNEPSVEGTYLWTPPADAVAGQEFQVKIRARDFADNDGTHAITLVVPDTVLLTGDQTVDGTDAGQSLALAAGTFTMSEPLALNELVILHAGELLSAAPEMKFDVTGVMKVQCGGLVDATGAGYAGGTSAHPDGYGPDGLQPSTPDAGGSHGGVGQLQGAASQAGEIFDSVYQPSLGGGGGASVGSYYDSGAGGGVLVIDAHEVVVDGQIAARGKKKKASGAGGSILITTGVLRGDGMIDVSGGEPGWVFIDSSYKDQTAGGGGRIAIRATDLSGFDVTVQALARGGNTAAGPGTVYAFTEGTSTCGRLVIDGGDDVTVALPITELPELGSGTLTGTLTGTAEEEGHLWVTGTAAFPVRWRGAWMRLLDENGDSLGSFRVIDRDPAGQQLLLRDAAAAAAVAYQGEYCFDEVVLGAGVRLSTSDPTSETAYVFQGDNEIDGEITATDILVKGGAHIRPLTGGELRLLASGTITIEEEAVIEVNGLGYPGGTDTHPDGYGPDGLQPSAPVAGGSHGGAGELKGDGPVGEHYGSVYQPMLGGGGGAYAGGTGNGAGGGVLVIAAQQVVLDGALEARGLTGLASGAGGSILIAANVLEGGGMIDASGGESGCLFIESCKPQAAGGGGRIGIHVTESYPFDLTGDALAQGGGVLAEPGTVYTFLPGSTYGDLRIDGDDAGDLHSVKLPVLGSGTILATEVDEVDDRDLWVTGSSELRVRWLGAWMELLDGDGNSVGTYEVIDRDAGGRLLLEDAETAAATAASYRGEYRFDEITLLNAGLQATDPVREARWILGGEGDIAMPGEIAATEVVIGAGITVRPQSGGELRFQIDGAMTIEQGARLDVSGLGFSDGNVPELVEGAQWDAGGSHGGSGLNRYVPEATLGEIYDSVLWPSLPGAGSAVQSDVGNPGGGLVALDVGSLDLDGEILARGVQGDDKPGGAGGSVLITADTMSGVGSIDVSGGDTEYVWDFNATIYLGAGGGGRIAIHAKTDLSDDFDVANVANRINAQGGMNYPSSSGSGTLFVHGPDSIHGDLVVDYDRENLFPVPTVLPSIGQGIVGVVTPDSMDETDLWIEPQDPATRFSLGVVGMWVRINGGEYLVIGERDRRGILLEAAADAADPIDVGDDYLGLYKFDSVSVLNGATLEFRDAAEVATWNVDADSEVIHYDWQAPVVTIVEPAEGASFASGAPIAVSAEATDNTAVVEVRFELAGRSFVDTEAPYAWDVPAPAVAVPSDLVLTVEAVDDEGNRGSATRTLPVEPIEADASPVVTVACGQDAVVAPGTAIEIRIDASSPDAIGIDRVELYLGAATEPMGVAFDPPYVFSLSALETATAGELMSLRAVAVNFAARTEEVPIEVLVVDGQRIAADTYLAADDLSLEGATVVVADSRLTVAGTHHFGNLFVLSGVVEGVAEQSVDLQVDGTLRIHCGAQVDVSGQGYPGVAYGASAPEPSLEAAGDAGGSYGGVGLDGYADLPPGEVFDSVSWPSLGGGSGASSMNKPAGAGGGTVKLDAGTVIVDGEILANGGDAVDWQSGGGAGGAVVIEADVLKGGGRIEASGGISYLVSDYDSGAGGGGRVALHVDELTGFDPQTQVEVYGGTRYDWNDMAVLAHAGPGTIYVSTPALPNGELIIDGGTTETRPATPLPVLGSGAVTAITTPENNQAWVSSTEAFRPRWRGAFMVLHNASGTKLGACQVIDLDAQGRVLLDAVPSNVNDAVAFNGEYRFDALKVRGGAGLEAEDPVRAGNVTLADQARLPSYLEADNLTVEAESTVRSRAGGDLVLTVSGTLTIENNAKLDVSGQGWPGVAYGASAPEGIPGPAGDAGGSYGGVGLHGYNDLPPGEVFDSVSWPALGGGSGASGINKPAGSGGGTVKLDAGTVIVDGEILANGGDAVDWQLGGGAGGAVVIEADVLKGIGRIVASGGLSYLSQYYDAGAGGGGRVALHVDDLTEFNPATQVEVSGGIRYDYANGMAVLAHAGPGTIYISTPTWPNGELIIDGGTTETRPATPLPVLGSGEVTAITALDDGSGDAWVSSTEAFRPRWLGAWMVLHKASVNEMWEPFLVKDLDDQGRVRLAGAAIAAGDTAAYHGEHHFDLITLRGGGSLDAEDPVRAGEVHLYDQATLPTYLDADHLTVHANSTVRSAGTGELHLTVSGTLTVEGEAALDVSGQGYPGGPLGGQAPEWLGPQDEVAAGKFAGGSHGGVGLAGKYGFVKEPGEPYDSVYQPFLGGGSGGGYNGDHQGGDGGGVLFLEVGTLELQGAILANGIGHGTYANGGGAGGTIVIAATAISGAGRIEASGGSSRLFSDGNYGGAGGGGRVTIDAGQLNPAIRIEVRGGIRYQTQGEVDVPVAVAAPGTLLVTGLAAPNGDLFVDQGAPAGLSTPHVTLPAIGRGVIGAIEIEENPDNPGKLWIEPQDPETTFSVGVTGMWVRIGGYDYRVVAESQDRRHLLLDGATTDEVSVGDAFRGVYYFNVVTVSGGTTVEFHDFVEADSVVTDADSEVIFLDQTPPVIDAITPAAGAAFYSCDAIDISVEASDNIGVSEVRFEFAGQSFSDPEAPFEWSATAPEVTESADFALSVTALDAEGNQAIATRTIRVEFVCTYAIDPIGESFPAAGGTGTVTVTTPTGCDWTAGTADSWIRITAGSSGTGPGTVDYQVTANPSTESRAGTLSVAGQTVTVTQAGLATFLLSVVTDGSGAGTVTSSPAGVDCGVDCGESFTEGTLVSLTAAPAADAGFAGWSGACSGSESCTVTMTAPLAVTATFSQLCTNPWTGNGPDYAYVETLALVGSTLYAGTTNAIFESTDGGANWGMNRSGRTYSLTSDPTDPSLLYAGSNSEVLRSIDGGVTWSSAIVSGKVKALAVDPADTATVYAGARGSGVLKSSDYGATWQPVSSGFTNLKLTSLAIDPNASSTLYAGTEQGGIFKTVDAGGSWTAVNTGLSSSNVRALAIDPLVPANLFAAAADGVYRSADAAVSWELVLSGNMTSLSVTVGSPLSVYAGDQSGDAWKSSDGGTTWELVADLENVGSIYGIAIDSSAAAVYLGTSWSGVIKSVDDVTWNEVNHGLNGGRTTALAIDPATPAIVYVANREGRIYKTIDGGAHWSRADAGLPGFWVTDVVVDPTDPSTVYASNAVGVYKSVDGGGLWTHATTDGLVGEAVSRLAIDPAGSLYAAASFAGVYRTTDGGGSWQANNTGLTVLATQAIAIDPGNPSVLYVSTYPEGLFKSEDAGQTWTAVGNGLPDYQISDLMVDSVNGSNVYAGIYNHGVYKSTDGGVNWSLTGMGPLFDYTFAIHPTEPRTLYASTRPYGIQQSVDGGATWYPRNEGRSLIRPVAMAIAPQEPYTVFVSTKGRSVQQLTECAAP
ncbi:MAG: hypothetical protein GY856_24560, partial [bacterium]|nr:hypothetical protein [bacterium]